MAAITRRSDLIVNAIIKTLRLNRASIISCGLAGLLSPAKRLTHKGVEYILSCPNHLAKWRVDTFFTKEPETIEWIDSFGDGEILFDIGANIGLYSIYAAKRGVNVLAFEPESQNYALLNKNVYLNHCEDGIMCLNIALSDRDSLDRMYIPTFQAGGAINCFGSTKDWNDKDFKPVFKQGIISYSLDSFIERYPGHFPSRIKIDVDGIEPLIINGSCRTLRDNRLKSVLIEINEGLGQHLELVEQIRSSGFSLVHKKHSAMVDNGPYDKCFNYIFARDKFVSG